MIATQDTVNEAVRLTLQARLDAGKTAADRNRLGQFATPTALATDILTYAKALLPAGAPVRFLDPAIGTGSFYSALLRVLAPDEVVDATGYEIDPYYGREAHKLWDDGCLTLHIADFTRATSPPTDALRANLLICNPPYVRHHHMDAGEKVRLQRMVRDVAGVNLSGLAGLYCYFLCLAHAWMAADGVAGWLIPSEFLDVNYGRQVKDYLLDRVTLLHIHRFDPDEVQFADALVSSAVVWFRKTPPPTEHSVEFSYGGALMRPRLSERVPVATLREASKWSGLPLPVGAGRRTAHGLRLSDLFSIKRGMATGANDFFILTPEQIAAHELPAEFLTPILPNPRYVTADEVEADADGLPLLDRRLMLLSCRLPEVIVRERYPFLWRYYQQGEQEGVRERYLCKHRSPWYVQEDRQAAPLVCTYMGRQNTKSGRPFRFILNHSRATAHNVYLLLYPKPRLAALLHHRPDLLIEIWKALNTITPHALLSEGRVYGGGLHKMEPKELGNVSAAVLLDAVPALAGERLMQHAMFDELLVAP